MEKNSKSNTDQEQRLLDLVKKYKEEGILSPKIIALYEGFYYSYKSALKSHDKEITEFLPIFFDYLEKVKDQIQKPYIFEPYHEKVTKPYDYHQFGINFIKPLVYLDQSYLLGEDHLREIEEHIKKQHNVIFLANHQIEPDPQAIFILLEPLAKQLIDHLIFVAGERVIIDPLAVPFSLGCNLLCIYSKRYIDSPPEKKAEKQLHNGKTMKLMKSLLDEGSKCIYVAPSGGRDRKDHEGNVSPAPFDPQSVEMFYLMAKHASKPTFFYPLALATYSILPPPKTIQTELGEMRHAKAAAIRMAIGPCISMDNFPGHDIEDKLLRRIARADYIYNLVCKEYDQLK